MELDKNIPDLATAYSADPEVEQNYLKNWKEILEPDGVLDMEQLKKELFDFTRMMGNMMTIVSEITNNRMSYATYPADTVLQVANECREEEWEEYLKDCTQEQQELIAQQQATIDKMRGHLEYLKVCLGEFPGEKLTNVRVALSYIDEALNQPASTKE